MAYTWLIDSINILFGATISLPMVSLTLHARMSILIINTCTIKRSYIFMDIVED